MKTHTPSDTPRPRGAQVKLLGHFSLVAGWLLTLGCDASLGGSKKGEEDSRKPSQSQDEMNTLVAVTPEDIGCDIQAVMAKPENSCTNAGCHGAQFQAGLDLRSMGLEERVFGVPGSGEGCESQLLVNPENPESSLLLAKIDPDRFAKSNTCGDLMPTGSKGLSGEDLGCFERWVTAMTELNAPITNVVSHRDEWVDVSVESYMSKVKALANGEVVTAEELAAVREDPTQLRSLVAGWVEKPGFEAKLFDFLQVALQQKLDNYRVQQQLDLQGENLTFPISGLRMMHLNAMESFTRTAQKIVLEGRPFTEVLTTREVEMTTALMTLMSVADLTTEEKQAISHWGYRTSPPSGAPSGIPTLQESIATGYWYMPEIADDCGPRRMAVTRIFDHLYGRGNCSFGDNPRIVPDSDFEDWRTVTIVEADDDTDRVPFWDFLTLRDKNELHLKIPRAGFFTSLAFLANWATNEDNQFRVAASQTMIVALGREFVTSDLTPSLTTSGLSEDHAQPQTACYSCHALLDPMRNYFAQNFSFNFQRADPQPIEAGFAFRGEASVGGNIQDFAQKIAEHPLFATAWTQKLCYYANSQACDETDPEFIRIANAFEASNFDLKTLYIDLLSSPLVTGETYSETYDSRPWLLSITRQSHLCNLLDQHLGYEDVCAEGSAFIGLIPEDGFARGQAAPVQTAVTSGFHFAAVDALCARLATRLVSRGDVFDTSDAEGALSTMVDALLGLPEGHSRRAVWRSALDEHYQAVRDAGGDNTAALRSSFNLACASPEVMAMGL